MKNAKGGSLPIFFQIQKVITIKINESCWSDLAREPQRTIMTSWYALVAQVGASFGRGFWISSWYSYLELLRLDYRYIYMPLKRMCSLWNASDLRADDNKQMIQSLVCVSIFHVTLSSIAMPHDNERSSDIYWMAANQTSFRWERSQATDWLVTCGSFIQLSFG